MKHEEKVIFLFSQTCTLLAGQLAKSGQEKSAIDGAIIRVAPEKIATRNFDAIYNALEAKLDEKLSSVGQ